MMFFSEGCPMTSMRFCFPRGCSRSAGPGHGFYFPPFAMESLAVLPTLPYLPKRRRLTCKQPDDIASNILPHSAHACGPLWRCITAAEFAGLDIRRKYKLVYSKYDTWWMSNPVVTFREEGRCSRELWNLARADYQMLTRPQKSLVLLFFLEQSRAPDFVLHYAMTQWLSSARN